MGKGPSGCSRWPVLRATLVGDDSLGGCHAAVMGCVLHFCGISTDAVFPTRSVPLIGFPVVSLVLPYDALVPSLVFGGHGAAGVGKSSLISDLIHEGFQPTVQAVLPIVVLPPEGTFGCGPPRAPTRVGSSAGWRRVA